MVQIAFDVPERVDWLHQSRRDLRFVVVADRSAKQQRGDLHVHFFAHGLLTRARPAQNNGRARPNFKRLGPRRVERVSARLRPPVCQQSLR